MRHYCREATSAFDVFFVLSGFLITTLLVQEFNLRGSISLRNFYIRRVLRLGPALIVMLIVICTLSFVLFDRMRARQNCICALICAFLCLELGKGPLTQRAWNCRPDVVAFSRRAVLHHLAASSFDVGAGNKKESPHHHRGGGSCLALVA